MTEHQDEYDRSLILDNRPSLNPEAEVFPKEEWNFYLDDAGQLQFQVSPGTWWDLRKSARENKFQIPKFLLALVGCPSCHQAIAVDSRFSKIDSYGKIEPDVRCGINRKCEFVRQVYLDRWNTKPLYCIVFEDRDLAGNLKFVKRYCHATSQAEAIQHYGPSERRRIFDVAPAIGYKVLDKHGEKLSA